VNGDITLEARWQRQNCNMVW